MNDKTPARAATPRALTSAIALTTALTFVQSAATQPTLTDASISVSQAWPPAPLPLSGPAPVEHRDIADRPIVITLTFNEPLVAFRRVDPINAQIIDLQIHQPTRTATITIGKADDGDTFGVRLVDPASNTGIAPSRDILLVAHTADTDGSGLHDLTDLVLFANAFLDNHPDADITLDGLIDQADITRFVQAFLSATPLDQAAPRLGPIPTLHAPAGQLSRPITIPLRDDRTSIDDLHITITSDDQSIVSNAAIALARTADAVTIRATAAPAASGSTSLNLSITDGDGAVTTADIPVTARPDAPPTARFNAEPHLGVAPLPVVFDASDSTDELRNIASYHWDFGNNRTAQGPVAAHIFTSLGNHTVTLTVTDDSGNTDTFTRTVTVAGPGFDPADPADLTIDRLEAKRFLWQAAFGPSNEDIDFVVANGFEAWIDRQMALPITGFEFQRYIDARNAGVISNDVAPRRFFDDIAVLAEDQLRQRTAWALMQVIVMNAAQNGNNHEADMLYYNRYLAEAFGNYADLLDFVTLTNQMGRYLTYDNSSRANPNTGVVPDENYAREVMQLFTIGLHRTDDRGTQLLDPFGDPIPTYDIDDVVQFARSFTGLRRTDRDDRLPMTPNLDVRELGEKQLLDYPGAVPAGGYIPANFAATQADVLDEISLTLSNLFHHPNCPPFIAELLIKRFTTSNPTRDYVGRVAQAFRGQGPYGSGVRGDLAATVKAILLDPEARNPAYRNNPAAGRIMEPFVTALGLLRVTRMVDNPDNPARIEQIVTSVHEHDEHFRQSFMGSPSVFNFYLPDYAPPESTLERAGLTSPELQIHNSVTAFSAPNEWLDIAFADGFTSDYLDGLSIAANHDPETIVDMLIDDIAHRPISAETRAIIIDAVTQIDHNRNGVRAAARLLIATPEFTVLD